MKKRITVFAPATVANIGCGFDSMGLAIESPGDELTLEFNDEKKIRIRKITGDQKKLSTDSKRNTAGVAIQALLDAMGINQGFDVYLSKKMPLGSGLGSSAASAVAAAFAANELLGQPFSRQELIRFAMEGEKLASGTAHADNAGPSMLGGIVLIRSYNPFEVISLAVPEKLVVVVVHPDVVLLTKNSRAVLPKTISLTDGIAQWSNTAALVAGLYTNNYSLIGRSVSDRIAEPHRASLIPCFNDVKASAIIKGALACNISGSGPSIFALADGKSKAAEIAKAMRSAFAKAKIKSTAYISLVNKKGVRVVGKS
jgi:homoserine kinase